MFSQFKGSLNLVLSVSRFEIESSTVELKFVSTTYTKNKYFLLKYGFLLFFMRGTLEKLTYTSHKKKQLVNVTSRYFINSNLSLYRQECI